jgi:hypothetical protein
MGKKKSDAKNGQKHPKEIRFDYLKSSLFRVVHADGAFGGPTPRGGVHIAFWNERAPIPNQVVHLVTPDGKLGEEDRAKRVTRDAIIREVEVGVTMSLPAAKSFLAWLQDKIKVAEEVLEEGKSEEGGDREVE